MSWTGCPPKISKAEARTQLPAKACRGCVYLVRAFPDKAKRERMFGPDQPCSRCGNPEYARIYPGVKFSHRFRFVYAGGRVEWREVPAFRTHYNGPESPYIPPHAWIVREYGDPPPFRILPGSEPPPMRGIYRVFHRQDYAYPPGFIGPHRAPEYHEVRR